jgi:hypothetical protein
MTTSKVRDQRVAAATKRVEKAREKLVKHQGAITQAHQELAAAEQQVGWLEQMPVDDEQQQGVQLVNTASEADDTNEASL